MESHGSMSYYKSLQKNNEEHNSKKQVIIEKSGENVEFISDSSSIEEVEDLQHHKSVKDHCKMSRGTINLKNISLY